jgi:hypothetical protein
LVSLKWWTAVSGRACSICSNSRRFEIDEAVSQKRANRTIAKQFGLTASAVQRHGKAHLPVGAIVKAKLAELTRAEDILAQLAALQASSLAVLAKAESVGDLRAATGAITAARGNLELIAKLIGELREGPVVNIVAAPEWTGMRTAILVALQPFPAARIAVAEALRRREALVAPEAVQRVLGPVTVVALTSPQEVAPHNPLIDANLLDAGADLCLPGAKTPSGNAS